MLQQSIRMAVFTQNHIWTKYYTMQTTLLFEKGLRSVMSRLILYHINMSLYHSTIVPKILFVLERINSLI